MAKQLRGGIVRRLFADPVPQRILAAIGIIEKSAAHAGLEQVIRIVGPKEISEARGIRRHACGDDIAHGAEAVLPQFSGVFLQPAQGGVEILLRSDLQDAGRRVGRLLELITARRHKVNAVEGGQRIMRRPTGQRMADPFVARQSLGLRLRPCQSGRRVLFRPCPHHAVEGALAPCAGQGFGEGEGTAEILRRHQGEDRGRARVPCLCDR